MSCAHDMTCDPENGRTFAMHSSCGIQFAVNLIDRVGGVIPLHSHGYAHLADVRHGVFLVDIIAPGRPDLQIICCSPDLRSHPACTYKGMLVLMGFVTIPAGDQHRFTLMAHLPGQPGSVTCMWGDGQDREEHD